MVWSGWAAAAALLLWLLLPGRGAAPEGARPRSAPGIDPLVQREKVEAPVPAAGETPGLRLVDDTEFLPFLSPEAGAEPPATRDERNNLRPTRQPATQHQLIGARDF